LIVGKAKDQATIKKGGSMFRTTTLVFLALFFFSLDVQANSLFGKNRLNDQFKILSIEDNFVKLEGEVKELKVGDTLYSIKSPFYGKVIEIKGKEVTLKVGSQGEIKKGMVFLRYSTDPIEKAIKTEKRLKAALEE